MWTIVKRAMLALLLSLLITGVCDSPGESPASGLWPDRTMEVRAAESGSIQVYYRYDNGRKAISGAEFSCIRIADAAADGSSLTYSMKEPYDRADYNPNAPDYGSDPDMAGRYLKVYQRYDGRTALKGVTTEEGICRFADCTPGLYLIWQSGAEGSAENYEVSGPLVVSVPHYENGEFLYSAAVYPKTSGKPVSEKPKKPRTILDALKPKKPENPSIRTSDQGGKEEVSLGWQPIPEVQPEADAADDPSVDRKGGATGDEDNLLFWSAAAGFSLAGLTAALIVMRRRRRRKKYQSPGRR